MTTIMIMKRLVLGALPIIAPLILVVIGYLIARRAGWLPTAKTLAASATSASSPSRIAEAIALLCAGVVIGVFTATNRSTGGLLTMLDQLRPEFAATNVAVAVCAAAGVLLASLVCLLWRTWAGVILITVVLGGYGLVLNGPEQIIEYLAPEGATRPMDSYIITLTGSSVVDADLWVNGVHLGKTPIKTTLDEFVSKVPCWPQPPEDFNDDEFIVPHYSTHGPYHRAYKRWMRLEIPDPPKTWRQKRRERKMERRILRNMDADERRAARKAEEQSRTYYAQVRLGNEWGYSSHGSGAGGGGGRYTRRLHSNFHVILPDRDNRLEMLLDKARLNDYLVDEDWFETMETYGCDGWLAVRQAMDEEPQMLHLLDAWATWHYNLDQVIDSKSAWEKLEQIGLEANRRQWYATSSVAGRAVELLVPKLDGKRLVDKAAKIVASTSLYGWHTWRMNDRPQFGISYRPEGLPTGVTGAYNAYGGGWGQRLPVSAYVVAHAVWMLDYMLDLEDDSVTNIVEKELGAAIVRWHYENVFLLRIAARLGGPDVEHYLLRQNWRAKANGLPWPQQMSIRGKEVNGWLYLLANLRSPAGQRFRRQHSQHIMQMADTVVQEVFHKLEDKLNFLFLDLGLGEDCLAYKYWPRFRTLTDQKRPRDALRLQFEYLARMEPGIGVQMYVDSWKNHRGDYDSFQEAADELDRLPIDTDKKRQLHAALSRLVQDDVSNIIADSDQERRQAQDDLLTELESELLPWNHQQWAQHILSKLEGAGSDYQPHEIAAWLEHERPDHPLVKMLADADTPQLRTLVTGAIKAHPTPENREVLDKLLKDSDEQVRNEAQVAAAQLKELADMPLRQLVAVPNARRVQ